MVFGMPSFRDRKKMSVVFRRLPLLLFLLWGVLFPGMVSAQDVLRPKEGLQAAQEKIEALEKQVQELQAGLSLYMENLGNCTEENEELQRKLDTSKGGPNLGDHDEKVRLMRDLQHLLKADTDLSFLLGLSEDNLKTLVDVVRRSSEMQE
jgi:cell division protein FtsB